MRIQLFAAALTAAASIAPSLAAQTVYQSQDEDRTASSVMAFGNTGVLAAVSISYSSPLWQDKYTGMLDSLKGRKLRLGKNWWTTLTTMTALEIGGTQIAAGSYVLGLACDKDGKFSVLVFDATTAMKNKLAPWAPDAWKGGTKIPLTLHKDSLQKSHEKMQSRSRPMRRVR